MTEMIRAGPVNCAPNWLACAGTPIEPYDVLIAGQVIARGLTLIIQKAGELQRVPSLMLKDWQ